MVKRTIKITMDDHENDKSSKKSSDKNIKIGPIVIPTKQKDETLPLRKRKI